MSVAPTYSLPAPPAPRQQVRILLIANFVYLLLVHAWFLGAPASTADLARLTSLHAPTTTVIPAQAGIQADPPVITTILLKAMHDAFGDHVIPYRLLNLLLLYACMVGIFFLTRTVLNGPWWLGSLAAVLTMANPVKTNALSSLDGVAQLLPAALAIWALYIALHYTTKTGFWVSQLCAGLLVTVAIVMDRTYSTLPFAIALLAAARNFARAGNEPSLSVHGKAWPTNLWMPIACFILPFLVGRPEFERVSDATLSVFLLTYPVGLLPATASWLHGSSFLAPGMLASFLLVCVFLHRFAKTNCVPRSLFAALLLCIAAPPLDPVTLHGGEHMIVPIALVAIAFAALCQAAMRHPAWPRHVVFLTTLLCILFFWLQISALLGATP